MPDDLNRLTAGGMLAGWQGLRKAGKELWGGVVEGRYGGTFGPDFGARLSKQLRLRGCFASYNFWRAASFVGHALTFQATTPP